MQKEAILKLLIGFYLAFHNMPLQTYNWEEIDTDSEKIYNSFCIEGYAQFTDIFTSKEQQHIDEWQDILRSEFLKPRHEKEQWYKDLNLDDGWSPPRVELLNPWRKLNEREAFVFTDLTKIQEKNLPESLKASAEKITPILHQKGLKVLAILEKYLDIPGKNMYLSETEFTDSMSSVAGCQIKGFYYPGTTPEKNRLACSEHIDYNALTILLTPDPIKRIQTKDHLKQWLDIPFIKNSVLIQVGAILQLWTQDYFKGNLHRVLCAEQDSFSTGYFIAPPNDYYLRDIGFRNREFTNIECGALRKKLISSKEIINIKAKADEQRSYTPIRHT